MNLEELGIPYTDMGNQKEIELFWHISQSLVSKSYLQEILQLIVTMTAEVMKSKTCSLMLLDAEKGELKIEVEDTHDRKFSHTINIREGVPLPGG